jgi:hypothetical protein
MFMTSLRDADVYLLNGRELILQRKISLSSTKVRSARRPRRWALVCLHTVILNAARLASTAELYVRWNAETVILYSVLPHF